MKEQDTGLMEKQYLSAEDAPSEEKESKKTAKNGSRFKFKLPNTKNLLFRTKQIFLKLKSPKILIIFTIVIIIFIAFLALLRLSSKSNYVPGIDIVDFSPTSPAPKTDPERKDIQRQVDEFTSSLEKLDEDTNSFPFPQVDIIITF